MRPLRALIVGGGRMGTGWGGFDAYSFTYCHAKLYREAPSIELVGVVEPRDERQVWTEQRWETTTFPTLDEGLETKPDIVSICTPAEVREEILTRLPSSVRGVLCEKPYGLTQDTWPFVVQVHYPRRFCPFHRAVRDGLDSMSPRSDHVSLYVWARRDMTTVVHFTSLAQWFGTPNLVYADNTGEIPGTNSYRLEAGKWAVDFRNGGVAGGFMESALDNLRAAIDGYAKLESPVHDAIISERWATRLVTGL